MEDANRMIKACDDKGIPLSGGHTRSQGPICHKIRDMIRDGGIGPLSTIVANLGGARAMMFRNGTHVLHGVVFFADSEPTHVFGLLEDGFDHWDEYMGDGGKKPESEPAVSGFIKLKKGVRAFFDCDKNTLAGSTLRLSGPKGRINFGLNDGWAAWRPADPEIGDDVTRIIKPLGIVSNYQVMGYVAAYEELISIVENGGGESVGSGRESRRVVQILTGFLKSHQEGSRLVEAPR